MCLQSQDKTGKLQQGLLQLNPCQASLDPSHSFVVLQISEIINPFEYLLANFEEIKFPTKPLTKVLGLKEILEISKPRIVILYTAWLKRKNSSNIVIGGFAGSAASMAGWSAATGSMDILGALVGVLVFVWTPSHFWCLAMKIRDDYAEAKVPMLPVLIGMQKTSKYILVNTAILIPYSLSLVAFGF